MAKRRHILERNKDKALALVLDGLTDAEVAAALSDKRVNVSRLAIAAFRKRHADELTDIKERTIKAIESYAIAQKVNRIATLDQLLRLALQVIEERGQEMAGEVAGGSTGLLARQFKSIGSGEWAEKVTEHKVDAGLMAEVRRLLQAAADELGQRPRPPTLQINTGETSIAFNQFVAIQSGIHEDLKQLARAKPAKRVIEGAAVAVEPSKG